MTAYPCYVLDLVADRARGEAMCAGVVAFGPDGPIVRIVIEAKRARALHPDLLNFDAGVWQDELDSVLRELPSEPARLAFLSRGEGFVARQPAGTVFADTPEELQSAVEDLAARVALLPRATVRAKRKAPPVTKLQKQIRNWLRGSKLYSTSARDIGHGRVVPNYPVLADADMFADFALMNGALHVIETFDLRGAERLTTSGRNLAGFKALLLDQVRSQNKASQRIAVFAADDYGVARPAMSLLGHYASDIMTIDNANDRERLASFVSHSLHVESILPLLAA